MALRGRHPGRRAEWGRSMRVDVAGTVRWDGGRRKAGTKRGGGGGQRRGECASQTKSEPRVPSLFIFQRLLLRSRLAVLRDHLPSRFLRGSPCKLLRCCV
jgi:hypothetical protein